MRHYFKKNFDSSGKTPFSYEIIRKLGLISAKSGYRKEFNLVAWCNNEAKYEIRDWDTSGKPCKGMTLTLQELVQLYKLIGSLLLYLDPETVE